MLLKALLGFSALQIIAQICNLGSALITVRALQLSDYGILTILFIFSGALSILSDGGVSASFIQKSASAPDNHSSVLRVWRAAIRLRAKLFLCAAAILTPLAAIALYQAHISISVAIIYVALAAAYSWSTLPAALLLGLLRLRSLQITIGIAEAITSLIKLGITLLIAHAQPQIWAFLLSALIIGISQVLALKRLCKITDRSNQSKSNSDADMMHTAAVKNILPTSVYGIISNNIAALTSAGNGQPANAAIIGIVSRITQILLFVHSINANFLIPRFAKGSQPARLMLYLHASVGLVIGTIATIVGGILIFPNLIAQLTNKPIAGQTYYILLALGAATCTNLGGLLFSLCAVRGWYVRPQVYINLSIAFSVLSYLTFGISSFEGVLLLSIAASITMPIIYYYFAMKNILAVRIPS